MTWPIGSVDTTDMDAGTDSPATARADLKSAVDTINEMIAHTEPAKKSGDTFTGSVAIGTFANPRLTLNNNSGTASTWQAGADSGSVYSGASSAGAYNLLTNATVRVRIADSLYRVAIGNGDSGEANTMLELNRSAAAAMVIRYFQSGVVEWWHGLLASNTSLYFGNGGGVGGVVAEMQTGAFKLYAATSKFAHRQSSQDVGEFSFAVANSRGTMQLVTRDTSGASARTLLNVDNANSVLHIEANSASSPSSIDLAQNGLTIKPNSAATGVQSLVGQFSPTADNSISCGSTTLRFTAFWGVNGAIQTSDLTDKRDIAEIDVDQARSFVLGLRPIGYRWIIGGMEPVEVDDGIDTFEEEVEVAYTSEVEVPLTETVLEEVDEEAFSVADGLAVRSVRRVQKAVERPVFDEFPVVNERGEAVMVDVYEGGKAISQRQATILVARMQKRLQQLVRVEKVVRERPRKKTIYQPVPGKRLHFGFGAQDVEQLYKRAGLEDFGGHVIGDDGKHALRVDQIVPFLATALKAEMAANAQLRKDLDALRARVDRLSD